MPDTKPKPELTQERLRELRRELENARSFVPQEHARVTRFGFVGLPGPTFGELESLLGAAEERDRLRARVAELEEALDSKPYAHLDDPAACSFCGDRSAYHVQGPLVRICETCARQVVSEFDTRATANAPVEEPTE
jgi:hypothetical protein